VKDGLTAIDAGIDNKAVAILIDSILLGDLAGHGEKVTGKSFVCRSQLIQRIDVPVGDNQDVGGRHRMDVPEGGYLVVLVQNLCR